MKIKTQESVLPLYRLLVCALFILGLTGCSVQWVSDYDEMTDVAVTQLHKEVETFFVTVEGQAGTAACEFENHQDFYQSSVVAISAIEVRANSIPQNELTITQIGLLKDSLSNLKQLHSLGCFTPNSVASLRSSFNSSFVSILTLELAKKRGE